MFLIFLLGTTLNLYTNDVTIKRKDTTLIPTIGMELKEIDTIIVKDSSRAEILYPDSSIIYLDENTKITTSGKEKRSIFMSFGRIWAKVKKLIKGESFEVKTPLSISGIIGTEFEAYYIEDKMEVKVISGNLNLRNIETGKETILKEGRMALIEKGMETKIQKFRKDQLKHWYEWKKEDIDFLLRKLSEAKKLGDVTKEEALTSQIRALAERLNMLEEYKRKIDETKGLVPLLKGEIKPTEKDFLYAISGDVSRGKTFILLKWPKKEGIEAYDIYRIELPSTLIPEKPINSEPISIMKDCEKIKKIILPGSEEYEVIVKVLSSLKTKSAKEILPKTPLDDALLIKPITPCAISLISETSEAYKSLLALSNKYWKIALLLGQAYLDSNVVVGKKYLYLITPSKKTEREIIPIDTAIVKAGSFTPLPAPTEVTAQAGDNKVLIRWNDVKNSLGYEIYRRSPTEPAIKINEAEIMQKCTLDLYGNKISAKNCFIDFMRWDEGGNPKKHLVGTDSIYGPYNGVNYSYKIRGLDLLGRPGAFSSPVSAKPQDKTPPAIPYGITVEAYPDGLLAKWHRVTHDELGHLELGGIKGYRVYRFNSADSLKDSVLIKALLPDTFGAFPFFKDTDPSLFSAYGEKTFWYRVKSVDNSGNVSGFSPSAGNHLPDTTPPSPPQDLKAESHSNHIALSWKKPNPVPSDLAGYNIYRGVCGGDSVCADSERIGERKEWVCIKTEYRIYPLYLVGNKDHPDSLSFNDYTVPEGSPICYRYSIKAYDRSQNLSDTSKTVCQKLREETPPPPPIIVGLKARDRAIKIEWVAPPVQDLFGFIVERAEKEEGPYKRVSDTLIFPVAIGCEDIPPINRWAADSVFSFLDTTVIEKKVYWYRIKAADYQGNIGKPSIPIETYTYSLRTPPTPYNLSVTQVPGECALQVTWRPTYDPKYAGFVVFRSIEPTKGYRQISPIIRGNKFIDKKIIPNKEYWYKVQYFAKNGNRSPTGGAEKGKATP
ncbi:MAG: FecR domain-containing protein [candidate division WOR-3 bacterium]